MYDVKLFLIPRKPILSRSLSNDLDIRLLDNEVWGSRFGGGGTPNSRNKRLH